MRRFLAFPSNVVALVLVGLALAVAAAAPQLAPRSDPAPATVESARRSRAPQPPDGDHPLGMAPGNLDVYESLIWGTRDALRFGLAVTAVAATLGVGLGAASAYAGGAAGNLAMRVADAFLAFPAIASIWLFQFVMFSSAAADRPAWVSLLLRLDIRPVMLALILFSWMPYARLVYAGVLRVKGMEFVEAARALGVGHGRILLRHLLPNAIGPVVVLAARDIGAMVILDATFSFIGIGGDSIWGVLLAAGRDFIMGAGGNPLRYWWVFLPVTTGLILFGLGWNLLGDGLNRLLDPRAARRPGPAAAQAIHQSA